MSSTSVVLPATPRRSWVEQVMGMPVSVLVRGPRAREAVVDTAVQQVYAELRDVDALFSTYRPDSQISRLDRGEIDLVDCDQAVRDVLELCDVARDRTGGLFDARRPDRDGARHLDPSGLVKGWAAERASGHLTGLSGHDWIVNAGGDVVLHAGDSSPRWRVGIEDPRDRTRLLGAVAMSSGGLATSGSAARGDHVVDPRTGAPARGLASVTVVGPTLLWSDVSATAAFVQGPAAVTWLDNLPLYEAMLVLPNGEQQATTGWEALFVGEPAEE